jgi:Zn-dependent peptidase ImmA (M78 family)/DNA-binding XRE family transcriptional regulator
MRPGTPGFRAARLRAAREARGISAISLADLVGVSRAAISQYEHGKQTPSPQVLRQIADRLNLPVHHFLAPLPLDAKETVFYRSFTSATKSARLRAQRRYEWFRDLVVLLRRFVKFPVYSMSLPEVQSDWRALAPHDIEAASIEMRRQLGVPSSPLPNVVLLLERAGVITARHEFDSEQLDAFSTWPPNETNPFVILGADKSSAVRSRFDAAHELGHIALHRNVAQGELRDREKLRAIELQANQFACALLLPKREFLHELGSITLDRLLVLKTKWGVSVGAMINRCTQLRVISDATARKLWIAYSRRGWKRREPYDELLRPEQPHYVRRSLEIVLERRLISREQLLHYVALFPRDVEELVGVKSGYLSSGDLVEPREILPLDGDVIPFPG